MFRSRKAKIGIALTLILTLVGGLLLTCHSRTSPKPAAQQPERPVAKQENAAGSPAWPTWGGAVNSADEQGAGFFSREKRRTFIASLAKNEQKYVVELNSRAFLPQRDLAVQVFAAAEGSGPRNAYLQFKDHPTPQQRDALSRSGVEVLGYVAGYAWQARATPESFAKALQLDFVRALAGIDPRDKLLPQVYLGQTPDYALTPGGQTRFMVIANAGTDLQRLQTAAAAIPALAAADIQTRRASVLGPRFEVIAPRDSGLALASIDDAKLIEFAPPPAASRDATTDLESDIGDVRDSAPNLSGAGVSVAVRELGKPASHTDFASRLQFITPGSAVQGDIDHATSVCGQIGSDGAAQPTAKGVAPAVKMLVYGVPSSGTTFSSADVVDAASKGARLSNHSYGPTGLTTFGDYQSISADWDNAISTNNLLGMFAGNEEPGQTTHHIDFFVGAKNTICVAATSAVARAGDDNPLIQQSDGISNFSQFGPMQDGRIKPDLVAFGDQVTLDLGANGTQTASGTSFSTPAVTGVAVLAFQQYVAVTGAQPSAALLKALLCNSATDLGNPGPDVQYGFGIVNAKAAVNTINLQTSTTNSPFFEGTLTNGQTTSFTVNFQGTAQLKATLVWMDVQGNPAAAKALVNDLDLTLTDPNGVVNFPYSINSASPLSPATNTGPNTVDPIEQVIVPVPAIGVWTVAVAGTSIPQNSQAFAVCVNVARQPLPLAAAIQASPVSGPGPLTVSFSSAGSTGNIVSFAWDYGDGQKDTGASVIHTYSTLGQFIATLTVTDSNGKQATANVTITVAKALLASFPTRLSANLAFPQDLKDRLSFTLTARSLVMTPQQSREALRDGKFEGQVYKVTINGIPVPTTSNPPPAIVLDRKATFKSPQISVSHNFVQGQIQVMLSKQNLQAIFDQPPGSATPTKKASDPSSTGIVPVIVTVETDTAIYQATFNAFYRNSNGRSGTARN